MVQKELNKRMKRLKKICAFVTCLSMMILMIPSIAHAAGAELRFSDPSTTVGANVDVTVKLTADSEVSSVSATLTFDSNYLRFVSGEGASATGDQIQLSSNTAASEISWSLQFQALQEGTTKIEVGSVTGTASDGTTLQVTQGNSTITIGEGDPSLITDTTSGGGTANGSQVEIDGVTYTISTEFSDAIIPDGFTKTEMTYEGGQYQAAIQESSGKYAVYMVNPNGEEDFFLYDPDNGKFSQFQQISISQDRYIVLLSEDKSEELPSSLKKTVMTVEGKEFPVWQNADNAEYYVVYALNSDGDKGYYQYDTVDKTYQRYTPEEVDQEEEAATSFLGKLADWVKGNMDKAIIGVWLVFLFMLIILIIVGIKLHHRNLELDDLYDEYGIDAEEEDEEDEDEFEELVNVRKSSSKKASGKGKKKDKDLEEDGPAVRKPVREVRIEEEDDFEAFEPEPLDEEAFDNFEGYFSDSDYDDEGYDGSDDFIDDTTDLLSSHPEKRRGHTEFDDTFKMDIIDLD